MAYKRYVEIFEEVYEKKDAKSVVSYVARDGRRRYIAGNKNPDGGTPMPSGGMVEVKWQELKDKRDNGELTPGSLYRITDYQCTTTQENTQSAGHQFDIVLLALSEDKLAEEGWAMMHDIQSIGVYAVTFTDEVTKNCNVYERHEGEDIFYDIVDVETLLGHTFFSGSEEPEFTIDNVNKTLTATEYGPQSDCLVEENLPYNYFQNSNLSAWKVWYCLDNDKSRFAWADDSVDEGSPASISFIFDGAVFNCSRHTDGDGGENHPFGWITEDEAVVFTDTQIPNIGDNIYDGPGSLGQVIGTVSNYTPTREGTGLPNGRGVIYRLIDEWNNDVPYDFKNIQFLVKNDWLYTMSNNGSPGDDSLDASVSNDGFVVNNYISKQINVMEGGEILGENILVHCYGCSIIGVNCRNNIVARGDTKLINCIKTISVDGDSILINCGEFTPEESGLYYTNKKVLTES